MTFFIVMGLIECRYKVLSFTLVRISLYKCVVYLLGLLIWLSEFTGWHKSACGVLLDTVRRIYGRVLTFKVYCFRSKCNFLLDD
jgi:hypothetical protein